jgi:hypothetical protein
MLRAANPAVITRMKARRTPAKRRTPKPRTIGVGESRSTRKPAAVARHAVAMVGPARFAAVLAADSPEAPVDSTSSRRAWNWIA